MKCWPGFFLCLQLLSPVLAEPVTQATQDQVVEQRLINITKELRCLVCQNESLADSRADLANDFRREIRNLIKSGKSDVEIKTFLVDRYSEFILYKPVLKPKNWLLWFGPFLLLLTAVWLLIANIRKHQKNNRLDSLNEDEIKKVQELMEKANY